MEWKEVSETEFYQEIGPQNVHPRIVSNSYPYTSVFVTPNGQEKGKAIGGEAGTVRKYMLPNAALTGAEGVRVEGTVMQKTEG